MNREKAEAVVEALDDYLNAKASADRAVPGTRAGEEDIYLWKMYRGILIDELVEGGS